MSKNICTFTKASQDVAESWHLDRNEDGTYRLQISSNKTKITYPRVSVVFTSALCVGEIAVLRDVQSEDGTLFTLEIQE